MNKSSFIAAAFGENRREWYVSHINGNDSFKCGSRFLPCQTLRHTLPLVGEDNTIYLDGRETERNPYGCGALSTEKPGGLMINKAVNIIGIKERAYVSCIPELSFREFPSRSVTPKVTLQYLAFVKSGVHLEADCELSISDCSFTNCAIALTAERDFHRLGLSVSVRRSLFANNTKCIQIDGSGEYFLEISDSEFRNNELPSGGELFDEYRGMIKVKSVYGSHGILKLTVRNSLFRDNFSTGRNGFVIALLCKMCFRSSVEVINSSFDSNTNGVEICKFRSNSNVTFKNVTFTNMSNTALKIVPDLSSTRNDGIFKLVIVNCNFINNGASLMFLQDLYFGSGNVDITIESSKFSDNLLTPMLYPAIFIAEKTYSQMSYQINLKSVEFISMRRTAFCVVLNTFTSVQINIEDSRFFNNEDIKGFTRNGAIVYIRLPTEKKMITDGCLETPENSKRQSYLCKCETRVQFNNTQFLNNKGYKGVVYLQNGEVRFMNCSFKDNHIQGNGAVLRKGEGSCNLSIENSKFRQQRGGFIFSESAGPLQITNSTFTTDHTQAYDPIFQVIDGGLVYFDSSTLMKCPIGSALRLANFSHLLHKSYPKQRPITKVTNLKVFCEPCPLRTYSLERGYSTGLHVHQHTCEPCPYGATCLHKIAAKPNFWGYVSSKSPQALTFLSCPLEYCQPSKSTDMLDFNSCYGNRAGILCGGCASGYSEALFTTKCRETINCRDNMFWLFTFAYIIALSLFLIFKPPVLSFLWRQAVWFARNPEDQRQETFFDPGYLKIIFYFYQIVELLLITSPEDLIHKVTFLSPLIGLFNFQVRSFDKNVGCPLPGLTAVTKEIFLSLKVFSTMACTLLIYGIHRAMSKTGRLQQPSSSLYLAVGMEILLLGYERLADTSMSLLHCVSIGPEWRLFLDGNVQCWQWWQNVLVLYIAVFVVPFIVVLYFGSLQLYRDKLSVKEFLGACVLPFPVLVYWAVMYVRKDGRRATHHSDADEVKHILHESFRQPSQGDKGAVHWESVLIGRRFVLLCLHAFIADPMVRLLCLDGACAVILAHHFVTRPYRSVKANTCETISLIALVTIATFNALEAAFVSAGLEPSGPSKTVFLALQWIEVVLLGFVPGAFGVLVMFTCLSQLARLVVLAVKGLITLLHKAKFAYHPEEQCQRLLDPTAK